MGGIFGVGIPEVLMVLVLTLIVVGPQRMPEVAGQIGRTVRDLRRFAGQFRREFLQEFDEMRAEWEVSQRELQEVRRQLQEAQQTTDSQTQGLSQDVGQAVSDVNAALQSTIESTARLKEETPPSNVVGIGEAAQRRQAEAAAIEEPPRPQVQRH